MPNDYTPFALVADDDPMIRMDAADILETAGFRTYEASGVAEALVILSEAGPSIQLLFTDVQMPPGEDGFYLARECAARWPHVGILVASGLIKPNPGDLPEGAVFVGKPFTSDVIYDRIQELLPDGKQPQPLKDGRPSSLAK